MVKSQSRLILVRCVPRLLGEDTAHSWRRERQADIADVPAPSMDSVDLVYGRNDNPTARFSPDDKFSRHRVTIKKRYGVLLPQTEAKPM